MSLEGAIHERWGATAALAALAPAERVLTGAARGDLPLPYVVLVREGESARLRTSSHTEVTEILVRFEIYAAELDLGKAIAEALRGPFNRQGFALEVGTCLVMQGTSEQEQLAADGIWTVTANYLARIALPVAS
ncbi:MAG: hypothetical protein KF708_02530 [Pirellulales bacterium]|nr:hypothetical protein [Pirellulales bacterium]